jgi:hypothetical protein
MDRSARRVRGGLASAKDELARPIAEEGAALRRSWRTRSSASGVRWADAHVTAATSRAGAGTLALQPDGSVLASGDESRRRQATIELETLRLGPAARRDWTR